MAKIFGPQEQIDEREQQKQGWMKAGDLIPPLNSEGIEMLHDEMAAMDKLIADLKLVSPSTPVFEEHTYILYGPDWERAGYE